MSRPHLHVVNTETGEVAPGCESCQALKDTLAGVSRKLNGLAAENTQLRRDKAQEALAHASYPAVEALHALWRRECGHPKSTFTTDDFWLAVPHYERHGVEMCERAIAGAKFDCWRTRRRNGSWKRYDDWAKHIFKDRPTFEEMVNRAPRDASTVQGKVDGSSCGRGGAVNAPRPDDTGSTGASR